MRPETRCFLQMTGPCYQVDLRNGKRSKAQIKEGSSGDRIVDVGQHTGDQREESLGAHLQVDCLGAIGQLKK